MSSLNKKFLISGCGFSWSRQERKTWVNVLQSVGLDITDAGGPAVSNQWIINQAFEQLLKQQFDHVIIQITSLGKLDVEIIDDRMDVLVKTDTLRNFTINGVWPSSHSRDHVAKAMYEDFLVSPTLETQDLFCKLVMLDNWCRTHQISLTVLQPYNIPWTDDQKKQLSTIVYNIDSPLYQQYTDSSSYCKHDHSNHNSVPCLEYHCRLAQTVCSIVEPSVLDRVCKISSYIEAQT